MKNNKQFYQGIETIVLTRQRFQQRTDFRDSLPAEHDSFTGTVEKFPNADHLVPVQNLVGKQIGMKLNGYFMDILRLVVIIPPSMFQLRIGDQHQFLFFYFFYGVSHNALCAFCILNIVQFIFGMYMYRKIKIRFLTLYQNKAILGRQR